jgi:hypothetical protein
VRGPADGSHGSCWASYVPRIEADGHAGYAVGDIVSVFVIGNLGFCNVTCWASVGRKVFLASKVSIVSFMVLY